MKLGDVLTFLIVLMIPFSSAFAAPLPDSSIPLRDGWQVSSACKDVSAGNVLSLPGYVTKGWYTASVPSTVLAVELENKVFDKLLSGSTHDPYFGMNLRNLPGMDYAIGTFFSNQDIPKESSYKCGWWYRRSFIAKAEKNRRVWLHFDAINYRADVWVNGVQVADATKVVGAYRIYDFDVTDLLRTSGENEVAVETFAPDANDLGINWVDWNPAPPDKDMGLWGAVSMRITGAVNVRSPMVATHLRNVDGSSADLTVSARVSNATDSALSGLLTVQITGLSKPILVEYPVALNAHEAKEITLTSAQFKQLTVEKPPLWWPVDWGEHRLERLQVEFKIGDRISDSKTVRFGIREVSREVDSSNHLLFRVNRRPILIRGGGWSPDMLLRVSPERMRDQFTLIRDLHLNTIRLEGKLESDQFFDLADERGLLVMAGWCCCDHWEHWTKWTEADEKIATDSLESQMLRLRHHASMLVWLNGSDGPPPEKIERLYLRVEKETLWPNAILSSAASNVTIPTGPSGVKMLGPYDYVVASYWERDIQKAGGAYGFNTETSPGPAIPSVSELRRFIPSDHLWPQDLVWDYHTGGGKYKSLAVLNKAMTNIFGTVSDVQTYARIAETMAYDSERAMFEAYGRNKYEATGVVQWMLNNAWPSLIWHLYDYYLQPGAGYYGTKKACEPLHIQYSYDDNSIVVVNSTQQQSDRLEVEAEVFDQGLKSTFKHVANLDSPADSVDRLFMIPKEALATSPVSFIKLELKNAAGMVISRNFYWIPLKGTLFDWPNTDYTHTPPATFEDLAALRRLPPARVRAEVLAPTENGIVHVRLTNTSDALAFQLSIEASNDKGEPYDSLLWSDNFVSLMPGETRALTASIIGQHDLRTTPLLRLSGWNLQESSFKRVSILNLW